MILVKNNNLPKRSNMRSITLNGSLNYKELFTNHLNHHSVMKFNLKRNMIKERNKYSLLTYKPLKALNHRRIK